ncbi:MAG: tRNA pseudouridine(38-40) synthase TruA [Saprospiraceae bacterium]|nr:MAG: tRNA pseudouridine(38-40) synthase TruA [Saprospiraceae bacterium]
MRYFSELAYQGTNYSGWQKQPNTPSIQATIEDAFSTILNTQVEVVGCGRTDAGVHASQYFLHFDFEGNFPPGLVKRVNRFLPPDIAINRIFEVEAGTNARFDATRRSYEYHLVLHKNPFEINTAWYFPFFKKLNLEKVNAAAKQLLSYNEFAPFCKTHTDVKTMICEVSRSEWVLDEKAGRMVYYISANRFLRGMVRLIAGMCLNAGLGKVSLAEVRQAMDAQTPLPNSWSVPPKGLFLSEVKYKKLFSKKEKARWT